MRSTFAQLNEKTDAYVCIHMCIIHAIYRFYQANKRFIKMSKSFIQSSALPLYLIIEMLLRKIGALHVWRRYWTFLYFCFLHTLQWVFIRRTSFQLVSSLFGCARHYRLGPFNRHFAVSKHTKQTKPKQSSQQQTHGDIFIFLVIILF